MLCFLKNFTEEQLYVDILKKLSDHTARTMLTEDNFTRGVQAQFYFSWSKWVKTLDQTDELIEPHHQMISDQHGNAESPKPQTPCTASIDLKDIISSGPYGPSLVSHYKATGKLNDKTRKLLVDAFLQYCSTTGHVVTKANCKSLSEQICATFDGEIPVNYNVLTITSFNLYFICTAILLLSQLEAKSP